MWRLSWILSAVLLCTGCGFKTDLTLPEPNAAIEPSPVLAQQLGVPEQKI